MTRLAVDEVGSANVAAFMDMLAWSEGTDHPKQISHDDGYDVLVGGSLFTSYAAHPRKLIALPRLGIKSTAAGRYQFIARTWDALAARLGLKDFSPASQDRACIETFRTRGALALIKSGRFEQAIAKCAPEWASLPGAGYGQHEHAIEALRAIYTAAGGKVGSYA
jgi:muramidase (phage lysozyme)